MDVKQSKFNPHSDELHSKLEHDRMLMNLKQVLAIPQGREVFKYLFKHFMVGEMPPVAGINQDLKDDMIGFMRAGSSIFSIAAQADNVIAGNVLAEIQKEKYSV